MEVARVERQVATAHLVKASEDDVSWLYPGTDIAHRSPGAGSSSAAAGSRSREGLAGAYRRLPVRRGGVGAGPGRVRSSTPSGPATHSWPGCWPGLSKYQLLAATPDKTLSGLSVESVSQAMDYAVVVAALTCTRPGADPPTAAELELRPA